MNTYHFKEVSPAYPVVYEIKYFGDGVEYNSKLTLENKLIVLVDLESGDNVFYAFNLTELDSAFLSKKERDFLLKLSSEKLNRYYKFDSDYKIELETEYE